MSSKAFEITAFSILGLLLVTRPTTLVPTLVLLLSVIALLANADFRNQFFRVFIDSPYKWIAYAFFAWFFIALLLAIIHRSAEKFYFPDNALRMLMATTLLAMVVTPKAKQWFIGGLILAGVASACWSLWAWPWSPFSRVQGTTNNAIHFGNLSAVIMLLSLTTALLASGLSLKSRFLLYVAGLGGLIGAVGSLTRSSFIVLLCILPFGLIEINRKSIKWWSRSATFVIVAVLVSVLMSSSIREKLRVTEALVDVQQVHEGNYMSSVGARVAMWQAAWHIFMDNPLLGVGPGRFEYEIVRRIDAQEIPSTQIWSQPHSDILHALSSGGIIKFLTYLGILVVPFVFFYRRYYSAVNNAEKRMMPIMGMQVVCAYFLTGLTNSNFDLQIYSSTYAVLVSVLAKLSMQTENAAETA